MGLLLWVPSRQSHGEERSIAQLGARQERAPPGQVGAPLAQTGVSYLSKGTLRYPAPLGASASSCIGKDPFKTHGLDALCFFGCFSSN